MSRQRQIPSVLFFSRGRGRGHAIPDIAIADEMKTISTDVDLTFVSYATGAETYKQAGFNIVDLGLPEDNRPIDTLIAAARVITSTKPCLVISHEEFVVLPAAKMHDVPTILLTDWFPSNRDVTAECVTCADSIIFLGEAGVFPPPLDLRTPPIYVGPVVRKMAYELKDKRRARTELELSDNAIVVSVIPGAWATEEKFPIYDLVLEAIERLPSDCPKVLLWISKRDYDVVKDRSAGNNRILPLPDVSSIERVMVASDIVLTKGNRGTILDLASLGVPSISISFGLNPIDDILVPRIRSNISLRFEAIDAVYLAKQLKEILFVPVGTRERPLLLHHRGGKSAALVLQSEVARLLPRASGTIKKPGACGKSV